MGVRVAMVLAMAAGAAPGPNSIRKDSQLGGIDKERHLRRLSRSFFKSEDEDGGAGAGGLT